MASCRDDALFSRQQPLPKRFHRVKLNLMLWAGNNDLGLAKEPVAARAGVALDLSSVPWRFPSVSRKVIKRGRKCQRKPTLSR